MSAHTEGETTAGNEVRGASRRTFLRDLAIGGTAAAAIGAVGLASAAEPAGAGVPTETYHITDYGATSGLNGAAGAGINLAIMAAFNAGGGIVLVPPGLWMTGRSIAMMNNVTLRGYSMTGSTIRMNQAQATLVSHPAGVSGASVENLTLDAGITAPTSATTAGLYYNGAKYCTARDLCIINTANQGVLLDSTGVYQQVVLENLFLDKIGTDAIDLLGTTTSGVFLNNITVNSFGALTTGFALYTLQRCHVSGLHVGTVKANSIGVGFKEGSEYSTLSTYDMQVATGGESFFYASSTVQSNVFHDAGFPTS